ncbi:splicing factor, arginine/serine-rich 19-like [Frankliniella occidentalis]|uniref:Splicing factor, arginine/serine-rich 19-like n=1 Tax=Frankliniella occidentalis TaxID=133901 RepID=A0A9C6X4U6_FRAOC|nr:splicing factor, arginine/serine-rich 19-like [Frankliniella occidentalis]
MLAPLAPCCRACSAHVRASWRGLATPSGPAAPRLAADPEPDPDPAPDPQPADPAGLDLDLGRGGAERGEGVEQEHAGEQRLAHGHRVDAAADSPEHHLVAARIRFEQLYAGVLNLAAVRAASASPTPSPLPAPAALRRPRQLPADDSTWQQLAAPARPRTWETLQAQMERQQLRLEQLEEETAGRERRRELYRQAEDAARRHHRPKDAAAVALTSPPTAEKATSWWSWRRAAAAAAPGDASASPASPGSASSKAQHGGKDSPPGGLRSHVGSAAMFVVAFAAGVLADNTLSALLPE